MKFSKCVILFILFLIPYQDSFCQCWTKDYEPRIYNEPDYEFSDIVEISHLNSMKILLRIDTSYKNFDFTHPSILSNKNFGKYISDSSHFKNGCIKNLTTQLSYPLGYSIQDCEYTYDLDDCFILFTRSPLTHKWRASVFDYTESKVSFYDFVMPNPIGYNDTCVFFKTINFKLNKKKYKEGTIISLNENGIKIIKPVFKKNIYQDYKCLFYSNSYKVYQDFLYKLDKDCNTENHYSIKISYLNNLIDSFETVTDGYDKPLIKISGDTITCQTIRSNFKQKNEYFRKYYKTTFIGEWKESAWVDSFPVLKNYLNSNYNIGDLFLVKASCYSTNKDGLKLSDGKWFTLNDVPLKKESTVYTLVIAFDIRKRKFIGYPKIEFVATK